MAEMINDSIKAKILKLLEMTTERGATEAEALVAMEKAQKLLEQHNLSIAELKGAGEKKDHHEEEQFPGYPWARDIASAIANLYDCRHLYYKGGDQRKMRQVFVGRQSNAETARIIAEFVVSTVRRLGKQYQREVGGTNRQGHDFQVGCSRRIVQRANQLWREANADEIRQREAEMQKWQSEKPNLEDLAPGTYSVKLYSGKYTLRKYVTIGRDEAQVLVNETIATPPRGVEFLVVAHVSANGEDYWFRVAGEAKLGGRRDTGAKDRAAYEAGVKAGEGIGLRIQVGGVPAANKLEG